MLTHGWVVEEAAHRIVLGDTVVNLKQLWLSGTCHHWSDWRSLLSCELQGCGYSCRVAHRRMQLLLHLRRDHRHEQDVLVA